MPRHSRSKGKFGQVVEAVLQIMEQDTLPKRMKRSKKHYNSAERFQEDHQAEYERYEQQSGRDNRARCVDGHNAACPKMKDELERRRSIAMPTAQGAVLARGIKAANQAYFDPNCNMCQKLKIAETKKPSLKTEPRSSERRRPGSKSRVSKPKKAPRKPRSTFALAKIRTNKGCQYDFQCTSKGISTNLFPNEAPPVMRDVGMTSDLFYMSNRKKKERSAHSLTSQAVSNPPMSQNGSKTDVISQNPDTSVNSISTYNSNLSLGHEPMGSP